MLIDFHTHTFPDELAKKVLPKIAGDASIRYYTEATNSSLLKSMDRAHVDMSVILPVVTKPSQCETINRTAKEVNDRYFPRLLSFGGIHPDNENYREILKCLQNDGIKGIKLHPLYQGVAIDEHHASHMMKELAALREKYDLHMTVERYVSDAYEEDDKFLRK